MIIYFYTPILLFNETGITQNPSSPISLSPPLINTVKYPI
jgi:hypothetical protein